MNARVRRRRHILAPVSTLQVSAVIPTYNRAHLLPRSIGSALAALGPGDEVVVVDDGSTDGTEELVASYGDQVRLVRGEHRGAGAARNLGYAATKGPLVAFLDSDDEWFPGKIELQRALFEASPELVYCCSDFAIQLGSGGERHRWLARWINRARPLDKVFGAGRPYSSLATLPAGREDFPVYSGDFYLTMLHYAFVATFTAMVRKEAAPGLHFAEDLTTAEDWPAFGALTGYGPGAILDTETARQNGHDGPRLTDTDLEIWADCWLEGLDRVWGSDPEFLAGHSEDYRQVVDETRLLRTLGGAKAGRPGAARRLTRQSLADPGAALRVATRFGNRYRWMIAEELKIRVLNRSG
jgi:hypothetical protein